MLHDDRSALALPCPVDFPSNIQAALGRLAGRVGLCGRIAPKARLLLAELVRCVNYKVPTESIRIKNTTLAASLGLCVRSVSTLKAELEDGGWIRRHQVKSRRRGMQVADVWLTPLTLEALGLVGGNKGGVDRWGRSNPQPRTERRHRTANACLFPQPSSKGKLAAPGHLKNEDEGTGTPLSPSEVEVLKRLQAEYGEDLSGMEDEGGYQAHSQVSDRVPKDLQVLLTLGLSEAGIFKLMGMATKAKCRLGDVLAVAGQAISKARKVFCYVRKLLSSKKDWARLAEEARGHKPAEVGREAAEEGERAELSTLNPREAADLAPEAHEVLGHGCLVDKEEGRVWKLSDGVIEELPLSIVALDLPGLRRNGGHIPERLRFWFSKWRGDRFSKDRYERMGGSLVRRHRNGELLWCTFDDAVSLGARIEGEVGHMKAVASVGKVVLNAAAGTAWRYQLGRLEQASLKPCMTRTGPVLQWAIQLDEGVEKRVARDLAEGRAVVVMEAEALDSARGRSQERACPAAQAQEKNGAQGLPLAEVVRSMFSRPACA
jgi:hypothetical protein